MSTTEQLLAKAFDDTITESEEAVLDRILKQWYDMCHAADLEDFDMWTIAPANVPLINPATLN